MYNKLFNKSQRYEPVSLKFDTSHTPMTG